MTTEKRFRRGDTSPDHPGKVFLRYGNGRESWVTTEKLLETRRLHNVVNAKQRKKPGFKEKQKIYFRAYNNLPKQRQYHSIYYKQPHVRKRIMARWRSSPATLERRRLRLEQKLIWETFKAHPEYQEMRREMHTIRYRDEVASGKWRRYYRNRRKNDLCYRLKSNLRSLIMYAMKRAKVKRCFRSIELLGCSIPDFRSHLEKQFAAGMTWDNYGKAWEIDHRVPLASFNLADPEQQKLAFNFHNCQPLWKAANRQKSDKIEGELFSGRELRNVIQFPSLGKASTKGLENVCSRS